MRGRLWTRAGGGDEAGGRSLPKLEESKEVVWVVIYVQCNKCLVRNNDIIYNLDETGIMIERWRKRREKVSSWFVAFDLVGDNDSDDDTNDRKDNQRDEEADPSLLTSSTSGVNRFVRVTQTRLKFRIFPVNHIESMTYPASVSFSTVTATVSILLIVSSCCSTKMLI